MIEKIYNYFVENSTLSDEYNRKLMTMLGAITIGIDYTFTFKNKKLELDITPIKGNLTKNEEYKLFVIDKLGGNIKTIENMPEIREVIWDKGDTFNITVEELKPYFKTFFNTHEENYKDYTYNRILRIDPNVFYIHFEEELTRKELDILSNISDSATTHFEVYKSDNGELKFF